MVVLAEGVSTPNYYYYCRAINAVGSENRTMAEINKKWSDIKL